MNEVGIMPTRGYLRRVRLKRGDNTIIIETNGCEPVDVFVDGKKYYVEKYSKDTYAIDLYSDRDKEVDVSFKIRCGNPFADPTMRDIYVVDKSKSEKLKEKEEKERKEGGIIGRILSPVVRMIYLTVLIIVIVSFIIVAFKIKSFLDMIKFGRYSREYYQPIRRRKPIRRKARL